MRFLLWYNYLKTGGAEMIYFTILILFLFVYILLILEKFFILQSTSKLIDEFNNHLEELHNILTQYNTRYGAYQQDVVLDCPEGKKHINALVNLMPRVKDVPNISWGYSNLSYNNGGERNFRNAWTLYNELLESHDHQVYAFKKQFNPKYAIIYILNIPSKIISLFGIQFKKETSSNIFNFVSWIIGTLVTIFQPEIKAIILELLK